MSFAPVTQYSSISKAFNISKGKEREKNEVEMRRDQKRHHVSGKELKRNVGQFFLGRPGMNPPDGPFFLIIFPEKSLENFASAIWT